jgi:predicted nucleic acid-binding protein
VGPLSVFDSSAFAKLLVEEQGSELASSVWDACDAALSSRLAYPEVGAALAVAARKDDLEDDTYSSVTKGVQPKPGGMVVRILRCPSRPAPHQVAR